MPAKERRQRDADIFVLRRRGISVLDLARSYNMTERQVRRIIARERDRQPGSFDEVAQERLEDHLDTLEAAMEDLALEAERARSTSQRTKAIAAKVAVLVHKKKALDEAGLLPRYSPLAMKGGELLLLRLTQVLERNEVPRDVLWECTDVIADWVESRLEPIDRG